MKSVVKKLKLQKRLKALIKHVKPLREPKNMLRVGFITIGLASIVALTDFGAKAKTQELKEAQATAKPNLIVRQEDFVRRITEKTSKLTRSERVQAISKIFLGKPYKLHPLGEGVDSEFYQAPLYRFDAFDCVTYVETVLALAYAEDLFSFQESLAQIRYRNGYISFLSRNHFWDLDWVPNNIDAGFVSDFTARAIRPLKPKYAQTWVEKIKWFEKVYNDKVPAILGLRLRLDALMQHRSQISEIPYIPFNYLFNKYGNARRYVFARIPSGTILSIVRPDWKIEDRIGTRTNVSHVGIVINKNGVLYLRHASPKARKIVDEQLIPYLKKYTKTRSVAGIHLLRP